jgi:hypothetical protein
MSGGVWRFAFGASLRGVHPQGLRLFVISMLGIFLGFAAAGCSRSGESLGPLAASRRASIAIESIDGPPPAFTRKLATTIGEEAEARQFVVVPREEAAQYVVRGYLSTHVDHNKTSISWVLDVYGADKRRAIRITGEELGSKVARDANKGDDWAGIDERVLRRIAQSGMDRILVFLNSSEAEPIFPIPAMIPLTTNAAIPLTTNATIQPPPS